MRRKLAISEIVIDETVLGRVQIVEEVAEDYELLIRAGAATLPPPDVFQTPDGKHVLADGRHRLRGYEKCGATEIVCEVHEGTLSDARWFAAAANLRHGLRPSREDRRRAALNLLGDPKHGNDPDEKIALQAGVSRATVQRLRKSLEAKPSPESRSKLRACVATAGALVDRAEKLAEVLDEIESARAEAAPPAVRSVIDKNGRRLNVSRIGRGRQAHREAAVTRDGRGDPIPPNLKQAAEDACLIDEALTHVSGIARWLERIGQTTAGSLLDAPAIMAHVNGIRALLKSARFYAVCACDGAGCPTCADRGWVTEREANNVPSLHQ